jgi:hypothetical protein
MRHAAALVVPRFRRLRDDLRMLRRRVPASRCAQCEAAPEAVRGGVVAEGALMFPEGNEFGEPLHLSCCPTCDDEGWHEIGDVDHGEDGGLIAGAADCMDCVRGVITDRETHLYFRWSAPSLTEQLAESYLRESAELEPQRAAELRRVA